MLKILKKFKIDAVVFFAAVNKVGRLIDGIVLFLETNVVKSLRLL